MSPAHDPPFARSRAFCAIVLLFLIGFVVVTQPENWLPAMVFLVTAMAALLSVQLRFVSADFILRLFRGR